MASIFGLGACSHLDLFLKTNRHSTNSYVENTLTTKISNPQTRQEPLRIKPNNHHPAPPSCCQCSQSLIKAEANKSLIDLPNQRLIFSSSKLSHKISSTRITSETYCYHQTMKLSFHLLSIVAIAPLVSAKYETVFTFKDDFFLKFCGLSVGMGPSDGETLIDGLDAQVGAFKQAWKEKIELLQDGACEVIGVSVMCMLLLHDEMPLPLLLIVSITLHSTYTHTQDVPAPKFSYCDWKYPERYDIERLPLASQCHEHGGEIAYGGECYVQRLFYRMKDLKVRCPNKLPMKDLNRSDLLEDALEAMVPALNINTVNPAGPWEEAFGVEEVKSNDECNAFLSINRFTEIDVDLKCLKEEFTIDKADMLKEALDEYFETNAVPKIMDTVEIETPMSAVYSVKSPYDKDGDTMYCYYPSYYSDGTLVDQYEAADGNIITKFKCGFDLVWFKDKGFNDSLLPDLVATVQKVFTDDDPSFLTFIQDKYADVAWVQNTEECGVIDINNTTTPTLRPTTVSPTGSPSQRPTNVPTSSPTALVRCYLVLGLIFTFIVYPNNFYVSASI